MTTVQLKLASDDMNDGALQDVARMLQADIERHTNAQVEMPAPEPEERQKGEPVSLGLLLVTFMTSGTAVAVFNVLKTYLERDQSVSVTVEEADGRKTTINASNLEDAKALQEALSIAGT